MDLQTIKAQWARTGALLLYVVTGILLVASLTASRSTAADASLQAGTGFVLLKSFAKTSAAAG